MQAQPGKGGTCIVFKKFPRHLAGSTESPACAKTTVGTESVSLWEGALAYLKRDREDELAW